MKLWHRCFMRPIDVQHSTINMFAGTRATQVLRGCDGCGRHDVETLVGEWPISLFLDDPSNATFSSTAEES